MVGIGHDSVLDPWYHYGVADQLDATFILLHYAHMSGHGDVAALWEMLTDANSAVFGLDSGEYGLTEGAEGSLVIYDATTPFDALRTRAPRTLVVHRGEEVARTRPAETEVYRDGEIRSVDYGR